MFISLLAGRSGDRIPVGARFSAPVQTGPETHTVSYTVGTGALPGVKRPGSGVVTHTIYRRGQRKSGAIHCLPLLDLRGLFQDELHLYFYYYYYYCCCRLVRERNRRGDSVLNCFICGLRSQCHTGAGHGGTLTDCLDGFQEVLVAVCGSVQQSSCSNVPEFRKLVHRLRNFKLIGNFN